MSASGAWERSEGDTVGALRERARLHNAIWLSSLLGIALGLLCLSGFGLAAFRVSRVLWLVLGYGAVYSTAAAALERTRDFRTLALGQRVLHLSSVVIVLLVWRETSGLASTWLLVASSLPVVSSCVLMLRGQAFLAAAAMTALVAGTMFSSSPGISQAPFESASPREAWGEHVGASWLSAPRGDRVALLTLFGLSQLALALIASGVGRVASTQRARLTTSLQALEGLRDLFGAVLRATPAPGALVYTDTGAIVHASESFGTTLRCEAPVGSSLFEAIRFDRPDELRIRLRQRIAGTGLVGFRLGWETRAAELSTFPIAHEGEEYTYVGLSDVSEHHYLRSAVESLESGILIVGHEQRLVYFNPEAASLLEELSVGLPVSSILVQLGLPRVWLRYSEVGRKQMRIQLGEESFLLTATVFNVASMGRMALLALIPSADQVTTVEEIVDEYYKPMVFTEMLTAHIAAENPGGSLALIRVTASGMAPPSSAMSRLVRTIERGLDSDDVLLGLRRGEFGVISPSRSPSGLTRLLQDVKDGIDRRGEGSRTDAGLAFHYAVVSVRGWEDLDSLMTRLFESLEVTEAMPAKAG